MTQTQRKVTLLAHTQLASDFYHDLLDSTEIGFEIGQGNVKSGQAVGLTSIRTCYSANKPSEILALEGERYFKRKATDGGAGTEADRLIRMIQSSGHSSTLEHLSFTFAIEGVSRALLAQLTRHRIGFSFSVQSQRYVKFGSDDRIGGFDYIMPDTIKDEIVEKEINGNTYILSPKESFEQMMRDIQSYYDFLRGLGVPAEDARAVLPNAASVNLVMTANLTALIGLYSKRRKGSGSQAEIAELVEDIRKAVVAVEPWADALFEEAWH